MAENRVERRLAAILTADVIGYSRLVRADEEGTVALVRLLVDDVIEPAISAHRGRVFKKMGDAVLAEFGSTVDAVRCAIAVQSEIPTRQPDPAPERHIAFRIGLHVGDVVVDGSDIQGDGVNVAARLEGLATANGICISEDVFRQVEGRIEAVLEDLGPQWLKNLDRPIRVYRVRPDAAGQGRIVTPLLTRLRRVKWPAAALVALVTGMVAAGYLGIFPIREPAPEFEPASVSRMAYPLPNNPSIAILPFDNLSGDRTQDYLADGLTESIISALSRIPSLFVIARHSTFTYKGKTAKAQVVAEELGVRYILEGSVQRSENRIRVTVQLADAVEGRQLWSQQYDNELTELFAVQDDITLRIVTRLQVRFTEGDPSRVPFGLGTQNLGAWAKATQGLALFRTLTRENNASAQRLLQEATEQDPSYAWAWTVLGWTHWNDARNGWSSSPAESLRKSIGLANKSLALDKSVPFTYSLLGALHLLQRKYDEALQYNEQAVALDPNGADAKALLGMVMTYAGHPADAVPLVRDAMRLNPRYPAWYLVTLGRAYRLSKRLDEAIVALERAKDRIQKNDHARVVLAVSYLEAGRQSDASAEAAAILELHPTFSISSFANVIPYKDDAEADRILDGLRRLGLPE